MSRLENAPSKIEIARLMAALVDGFCDSYRRAPSSITLDIDGQRLGEAGDRESCRCGPGAAGSAEPLRRFEADRQA